MSERHSAASAVGRLQADEQATAAQGGVSNGSRADSELVYPGGAPLQRCIGELPLNSALAAEVTRTLTSAAKASPFLQPWHARLKGVLPPNTGYSNSGIALAPKSPARRNGLGNIASDLNNLGGRTTNPPELPRQTRLPNARPPRGALLRKVTCADFRGCQQD